MVLSRRYKAGLVRRFRCSSLAHILALRILVWAAVALSATRDIHRVLRDVSQVNLPIIVKDSISEYYQDEFGINRFLSGPYKDARGRNDIKKAYGCKHTSEGVRPVYTDDEWIALRVAYQRAVGKERSTIDPYSSERSALVPLYVKHTPDKGRGVFAAKPIKKGQAIYTSRFDGWFEDWDSYRVFLGLVPPQSVCDVMEWTFHVIVKDQDGVKGSFRIVELDEGALSNSGGSNTANARDEKLLEPDNKAKPISYGTQFTYVATKDIGADEEILSAYSDHGHVHEYAGKLS